MLLCYIENSCLSGYLAWTKSASHPEYPRPTTPVASADLLTAASPGAGTRADSETSSPQTGASADGCRQPCGDAPMRGVRQGRAQHADGRSAPPPLSPTRAARCAHPHTPARTSAPPPPRRCRRGSRRVRAAGRPWGPAQSRVGREGGAEVSPEATRSSDPLAEISPEDATRSSERSRA